MIDRSGSEIFAMVLKAMRGAGFPLSAGQFGAETVARAGSLPALENLATAMEAETPPLTATFDDDAPVFANVNIWRDAPVIHDAVSAGGAPVSLSPVPDGSASAALSAVWGWAIESSDRGVCIAQGPDHGLPRMQRVSVDADTWRRLNHFAKQTYVPESDHARVSGAGAGLNDND